MDHPGEDIQCFITTTEDLILMENEGNITMIIVEKGLCGNILKGENYVFASGQ